MLVISGPGHGLGSQEKPSAMIEWPNTTIDTALWKGQGARAALRTAVPAVIASQSNQLRRRPHHQDHFHPQRGLQGNMQTRLLQGGPPAIRHLTSRGQPKPLATQEFALQSDAQRSRSRRQLIVDFEYSRSGINSA